MDHTEALMEKAAEKYLLGELTTDQQDAFEAHYFTCQECAEDIKAGAIFMDNAREVLRSDLPLKPVVLPTRVRRRSLWAWFQPAYAAGAIAVLVVAVLFQNLITMPQMRQELSANRPQIVRGFTLRAGVARSGAIDAVEVPPGHSFGLYVDIPPGDSFATYTCQVRAESGGARFALDVPAADARNMLELYVPGSTLAPGNYVLVVYGHAASPQSEVTGTEVARYPFTLQSSK